MPDDSQGALSSRAPCPICGKPRADAWRPFCSKRCADIDLGRWLGERYVIAGEPGSASPEAAGDAPASTPDDG